MGTRSYIGKKEEDKCTVIYCHWDGYLSHNGDILLNNYTDKEKVEKLISLGDISSLRELVDPITPNHSYDEPDKNVTVAYHRDRGEELSEAATVNFDDIIDFAVSAYAEYVYLFDVNNNNWIYYDRYNSQVGFHELTQEVIDED